MSTAEQQAAEDEMFDKDGNKIVFRDRPAAPLREVDDHGRAITRMSNAGARSSRGMDPMEIVRDHWNKGVVEDEKWLGLFSACIQAGGAEVDMAAAADQADRAYFEWWQRMEAKDSAG